MPSLTSIIVSFPQYEPQITNEDLRNYNISFLLANSPNVPTKTLPHGVHFQRPSTLSHPPVVPSHNESLVFLDAPTPVANAATEGTPAQAVSPPVSTTPNPLGVTTRARARKSFPRKVPRVQLSTTHNGGPSLRNRIHIVMLQLNLAKSLQWKLDLQP